MGRHAYDRMLREEQLLPFDSRDLESMGNGELAHGWAEEAWVTSLSQRQNLPFGPQGGGGLAPGGPALTDYYRERIAELSRFVVEHDVITLPTWLGTIRVEPTPEFMQPTSPGASMLPPRLFSENANGYYFITSTTSFEDAAARLDMNQDFDRDRIWGSAAHEAMPGHFLQLSVAKRHPDFVRKIQQCTVFQEGWAYYGEEMLLRLGLYGNDLDARLSIARWESARPASKLGRHGFRENLTKGQILPPNVAKVYPILCFQEPGESLQFQGVGPILNGINGTINIQDTISRCELQSTCPRKSEAIDEHVKEPANVLLGRLRKRSFPISARA
jgi:hypothetical protein